MREGLGSTGSRLCHLTLFYVVLSSFPGTGGLFCSLGHFQVQLYLLYFCVQCDLERRFLPYLLTSPSSSLCALWAQILSFFFKVIFGQFALSNKNEREKNDVHKNLHKE